MYQPQIILSENMKCNRSINLPIAGHCRPTSVCSVACYAKTGHCAMKHSTRKQAWVSDYLAGGQDPSLARLKRECQPLRAIRLSGTGDLNPGHLPGIINLAKSCPDTQFWGMTRKLEIAKYINEAGLPNLNILVSVDASSPESVWNYDGALCFGPRRPDDQVPADPRIITVFPNHFRGKVVAGMPHHPKDCRAVWHEIDGCMSCGQCWSWK